MERKAHLAYVIGFGEHVEEKVAVQSQQASLIVLALPI